MSVSCGGIVSLKRPASILASINYDWYIAEFMRRSTPENRTWDRAIQILKELQKEQDEFLKDKE